MKDEENSGREGKSEKLCTTNESSPIIPNVNIEKIHEFYDTFMYAVQSLETMGGLQQVNGNVALTSEKLLGIRGDLTRIDSDWENWDFVKLVNLGIVTIVDPLPRENYVRHVIKINHEGVCIAKIKVTSRMNAQR